MKMYCEQFVVFDEPVWEVTQVERLPEHVCRKDVLGITLCVAGVDYLLGICGDDISAFWLEIVAEKEARAGEDGWRYLAWSEDVIGVGSLYDIVSGPQSAALDRLLPNRCGLIRVLSKERK